MQVYRDINEIAFKKKSHLTIGTFDGIHVGHQKIIKDVVHAAKAKGLRSVLITFYPHPKTILNHPKSPIHLLTPVDEKIELLQKLQLDVVLIIPFSKELADMNPKSFVEDYLIKRVGVQQFSIGFNHAFGRDRQGNESVLRKIGEGNQFDVHIIPPVRIDSEIVSSTKIRQFLNDGDLIHANQYLGRDYQVRGVVQQGEKLGAKIGFPTANIHVKETLKLIPQDGVYAVRIQIGNADFEGMANIGHKPTVKGKDHGIEVHIHDFSGDLYNQELTIYFVKRIRDEKHFESVDALSSQIKQDSETIRKEFEKISRR